MALPPLERSWDTSAINRRLTALPSTNVNYANQATLQRLLWEVKQQLRAWGWVVRGSAGGASAGMDGVDRWDIPSDLLWGNPLYDTATSWIVLRKLDAAGTGLHLDVLIWLLSAVPGRRPTEFVVYLSYAGFSGGTQTTRPTAGDEVQARGAGTTPVAWTSLGALSQRNPSCWLHAIRTTDDQVHRVFALADGAPLFFLSIERARAPVAAWTHPLVWTWRNAPTYAAWHAASGFLGYDAGGTPGWMPLFAATVGAADLPHGQVAAISNSVDGQAFLGAIGLVSNTSGKRGRHGGVFDAWFVPAAAFSGDSYPSAGAQLVVVGNIAVPWDGISPLRSV